MDPNNDSKTTLVSKETTLPSRSRLDDEIRRSYSDRTVRDARAKAAEQVSLAQEQVRRAREQAREAQQHAEEQRRFAQEKAREAQQAADEARREAKERAREAEQEAREQIREARERVRESQRSARETTAGPSSSARANSTPFAGFPDALADFIRSMQTHVGNIDTSNLRVNVDVDGQMPGSWSAADGDNSMPTPPVPPQPPVLPMNSFRGPPPPPPMPHMPHMPHMPAMPGNPGNPGQPGQPGEGPSHPPHWNRPGRHDGRRKRSRSRRSRHGRRGKGKGRRHRSPSSSSSSSSSSNSDSDSDNETRVDDPPELVPEEDAYPSRSRNPFTRANNNPAEWSSGWNFRGRDRHGPHGLNWPWRGRGGWGGRGGRGRHSHPHPHTHSHHGRHGPWEQPQAPQDHTNTNPPPYSSPFDPSNLMNMFTQFMSNYMPQHPNTNVNPDYVDLTREEDQSMHVDSNSFSPVCDIFDTNDAFIVHFSLPGAKKEDISLDFEIAKSELSISGVITRAGMTEEMHSAMVTSERKIGHFERKVKLGGEGDVKVDVEGITAKMEDGVLTVTVPKYEDVSAFQKLDIV